MSDITTITESVENAEGQDQAQKQPEKQAQEQIQEQPEMQTSTQEPVDEYTQRHMAYPETTMFGALERAAKRFPKAIAFEFMGKKTNYTQMIAYFELAARALVAEGIQRGDVVTICLPNVPQAIVLLYALNRIGAVANMIHPLSSQKEITYFLDDSDSKMILTLDLFYEKVVQARAEAKNKETKILMARISDELAVPLAMAFWAKTGRKLRHLPNQDNSITWKSFIAKGMKKIGLPEMEYHPDRASVLLYSGGTTGLPKAIELSDYNFNVLGMQIREAAGIDFEPGLRFLSVMPLFHGFGLGIGIHTVLENGMMSILVPRFTNESYAKLVVKKKPNFIAGVPTIYASLLKSDIMQNADLSCLKGVFSGGDTLPPDLKERFDRFLTDHGSTVQIREGYGLTECVTASCLTPYDTYKERSIGVPLRDMEYRIVKSGSSYAKLLKAKDGMKDSETTPLSQNVEETTTLEYDVALREMFAELPRGEAGEIILKGPSLMLGYRNHPEETAEALRKDENGDTWLFTGDLGHMDEEGYVFFSQRIKRMIITSGYNVYPSQLEKVLDEHPDITRSCVIGIPDERRIQKIRAYIVLKEGVEESEEEKKKIMEYSKLHLAAYEKPREIVFRKELPLTLVGKVAFHVLEEEAAAELAGAANAGIN